MERSVMLERLEWLALAGPHSAPPEWLAPNAWGPAIAEVAAAALDDIKDQDRSFDLRWNADQRAIKRWQAAAPAGKDRSLTWPDHADLVVWLLEQLDRTTGLLNQLMEQWTWRPIEEAPIPSADAVKEYWAFPCLIQTRAGIVSEGFARWVEDGRMKGRREKATLRWYIGAADRGRDTRVCHDPKYFMPLPAKRED